MAARSKATGNAQRAQFCGVFGATGTGKSTYLRALLAKRRKRLLVWSPKEKKDNYAGLVGGQLVRTAGGRALYFSRAPLPWARDAFAVERNVLPPELPFLRHIGIYAYRAGFLRQYTTLSRTTLEQAESLEQLRVLEHGYAIAVRMTPEPFPPGIDTLEDLQRAEQWLQRQG